MGKFSRTTNYIFSHEQRSQFSPLRPPSQLLSQSPHHHQLAQAVFSSPIPSSSRSHFQHDDTLTSSRSGPPYTLEYSSTAAAFSSANGIASILRIASENENESPRRFSPTVDSSPEAGSRSPYPIPPPRRIDSALIDLASCWFSEEVLERLNEFADVEYHHEGGQSSEGKEEYAELSGVGAGAGIDRRQDGGECRLGGIRHEVLSTSSCAVEGEW